MSLFTGFLFRYISTYILYPGQQSKVLAHATDFMLRNFCLNYPLSYRVPVRERYGSTLLPAIREQHDQNCTQSH